MRRAAKVPLTPEVSARLLRKLFEKNIPKTESDYENFPHFRLTAYDAALMVQEQTKCTFKEACEALGREIPELFADYWDELLMRSKV